LLSLLDTKFHIESAEQFLGAPIRTCVVVTKVIDEQLHWSPALRIEFRLLWRPTPEKVASEAALRAAPDYVVPRWHVFACAAHQTSSARSLAFLGRAATGEARQRLPGKK